MHISQINAAARHVARYNSTLVDIIGVSWDLGASDVSATEESVNTSYHRALPRCRHHNIPLIDVEAMGSGMTPAQSDFDIHHPRDFYAMVSGGYGVPKPEPRPKGGGKEGSFLHQVSNPFFSPPAPWSSFRTSLPPTSCLFMLPLLSYPWLPLALSCPCHAKP